MVEGTAQTVPSGASPADLVRRRLRREQFLGYLMIAPPFLLMLLLILYPAVLSIIRTLTPTIDGTRVFGLQRYLTFFTDATSVNNLWFTIWSTLVVVGVLFAICLPIALYLRFTDSRLANWVQALALFPLFVPGIILAYALIRFLGPNGLFDMLLEHLIGWRGFRTPYLRPAGSIIALVWEGIPITVLIITAGLAQVPNNLIEAARDVGAGPVRVFAQVILPLVQRSLLIAFALNVLGVVGAFTLPYLLGPAAPQMMGPFMQRTFYDVLNPGAAETQAVVSFLLCAGVGILYVRTVVRERSGGG